MPKSSSTMVMPMALNCRSAGRHSAADSISAVSVISSSSRSGGSPVSANTRITMPGKSVLRNCTSDRLTATLTSAGQVAASVQAARNTQSPICVIKPVSSASGMNKSG